jgi:hypothetical protein
LRRHNHPACAIFERPARGARIASDKSESERPLRLQLDLVQRFVLFRLEIRQLRRSNLVEDCVAGVPELGAVFDLSARMLNLLGTPFLDLRLFLLLSLGDLQFLLYRGQLQ